MLCVTTRAFKRCPILNAQVSRRLSSSQPSTSSGIDRSANSQNIYPAGFDYDLFTQARLTRFVPPAGCTLEDCWRRFDEMLILEQSSHNSIRLGDLLVVGNVVFVNNGTVSLTKEAITELITRRVDQVNRFSNMFLTIQFLRFMCNAKLVLTAKRKELLFTFFTESGSLRKVSELVECLHLMAQCGELAKTDLVFLQAFKVCLRTSLVAKDFSPRLRNNTARALSCLAGIPNPSYDLVEIVYLLMKGRECDSAELLAWMTDAAADSATSSQAIVGWIRECTLTKRSVHALLKSDASYGEKLHSLGLLTADSNLPHADCSQLVLRSEDGLLTLFFRTAQDVNGHPVYFDASNRQYLYFSSLNSCWQMGRRTENELVRSAYLTSDSLENATGWRVWRKGFGFETSDMRFEQMPVGQKFAETHDHQEGPPRASKSMGVRVKKTNPPQKQWAEIVSRVEETSVEAAREAASQVEISELKKALETLVLRITRLEKNQHTIPGTLRKLTSSLTSALDSLGKQRAAQMDAVGVVGGVRTFDLLREKTVRACQVQGTRELVAKKFAKNIRH